MTTRRLLELSIAAPAVLAALVLVAVEVWRVTHPRSELFVTPFAYSLAEAIERDDVQRAYAFIRAGQDPTEPIQVRHPTVTAGRTVAVPPLLWAVAANSRYSAMMLLGFGAQVDKTSVDRAVCLADTLGNGELAALLRNYGEAVRACPGVTPGEPPLLSFLSN